MSAKKAVVCAIALLFVGMLVGGALAIALPKVMQSTNRPRPRAENMIALAFGPGKYGPTLYGACVFSVRTQSGADVRAEIWIDGPDYAHDCGVIATAASHDAARAMFNTITFDAAGIHAGNGTTSHLIAAAGVYDTHR
ncbi:MAG TPA: hypothetical protein VK157_12345 [Phycisphaerales bacterium]|nr:hypothetical protein [Phycisphaerales bacterium]